MSMTTSAAEAQLRALLAPSWQPLQDTAPAPLIRDRVERIAGARDLPVSEILAGAQAAMGSIFFGSLSEARGAVCTWRKGAGRALGIVGDDVDELEFATRRQGHERILADAILYLNGSPYTIVQVCEDEAEAKQRLIELEGREPVWFLFVPFVVAMSPAGVWVREPASPEQAWTPLADHELGWLLCPANLQRVVAEGLAKVLAAPDGPHAEMSSQAEYAVDAAVRRAFDQGDCLVSVAEGAGPVAVIRGLCALLTSEGAAVQIAVNGERAVKELCDALGLPPGKGMRPPFEGNVRIGSLQRLSDAYDPSKPPSGPGPVVIAHNVDAGFGGEKGFRLRQRFPHSPWISVTALPTDAIPLTTLHAFGNPIDDEGILAVVDEERGRVPIKEVITSTRYDEDELSIEVMGNIVAELLFYSSGQSQGRSLVLVQNPDVASKLAEALSLRVPTDAEVVDATSLGHAWEGWARLEESEATVIVIRASLPFWSAQKGISVDHAFVFRRIGKTTAARLRRILGRPRAGKAFARLISSWRGFMDPAPRPPAGEWL